eukprot:5475534-Alexandrium_andersonii.AAC.1
MSASLVGSEMCIRDRSPNLVMRWAGGRAGGASRGASHGRSPRGRLMTVSYTHLTLPTICSV